MPHHGFSVIALSVVLLAGSGCPSDQALRCTYVARESERHPTPYDQELQPRGRCATLARDGTITVRPDYLEELYFVDGLATVRVRTGWLYVTPTGRTAPVLTYDNGADDFRDGLARTIRGGKVGFIDRDLIAVIPPRWDFAFPFEGGHALVCDGCRRHSDGEHSEMRGGVWGYIDRSGQVAVPVEYERDDLPAPPAWR